MRRGKGRWYRKLDHIMYYPRKGVRDNDQDEDGDTIEEEVENDFSGVKFSSGKVQKVCVTSLGKKY